MEISASRYNGYYVGSELGGATIAKGYTHMHTTYGNNEMKPAVGPEKKPAVKPVGKAAVKPTGKPVLKPVLTPVVKPH